MLNQRIQIVPNTNTNKHAQLESLYRTSNLVSIVCVYAAADQSRPIAIVVPAPHSLERIAAELGIPNAGTTSAAQLAKNAQIKAAYLKDLQNTGRKAGLASFEILEGVVLTEREWTPQNVSFFSLPIFSLSGKGGSWNWELGKGDFYGWMLDEGVWGSVHCNTVTNETKIGIIDCGAKAQSEGNSEALRS